eukprot:COSAG06_NODE_1823_length_8286_cov_32.294613_2_plen_112_part_00
MCDEHVSIICPNSKTSARRFFFFWQASGNMPIGSSSSGGDSPMLLNRSTSATSSGGPGGALRKLFGRLLGPGKSKEHQVRPDKTINGLLLLSVSSSAHSKLSRDCFISGAN